MYEQHRERNLSMVMDFYELTMSNGYFRDGVGGARVAFDVYYRKNPDSGGFAIFAGLEQVIDYIRGLHFTEEDVAFLRAQGIFDEGFLDYLRNFRFTGSIYALREGTIMYPNTPIVTVVAPLIEAQLVETALLLEINHQSLIATKANRIVRAAAGRAVSDFGARRAHNIDSAVYGARASYIGGVNATATVLAGQMFDIPVSGTMAHSWVMFYADEFTAFAKYARAYPNACTLLVDTYDVLETGVPNAIRTAKEVLEPMGKRLRGIRLDSGDLAYLSKQARQMLDQAGLEDCRIVASNSLDEATIQSLLGQGAKIDIFGVGERLITARSEPVFGAVYKLVAVEEGGKFAPRIKISENVEKVTNPGLKRLLRVYDEHGKSVADLLTLADEPIPGPEPYRFVDPIRPWRIRHFTNCRFEDLQVPVFENGELVCPTPPLSEIRSYVRRQLEGQVWEEEQRFENPHEHYLDMSPKLYELKMGMLDHPQI
ncbi:MAG: nicotinate phosphoribosyltransferase [Clostridiales bacterium]|nr:nicotinate phosphoribosyltransferase [Clostridiales bacterium]